MVGGLGRRIRWGIVGAAVLAATCGPGAGRVRGQVERGTVVPLGDRAMVVRDQYGGATVTMASHGERALVGVGLRAHWLDTARPGALELLWQSPPQRQIVRAVALDDAAAFVGFENADGLVVFDLAAPGGPQESMAVETGGDVRNLLLTPQRLYVAAQGRLSIFDRIAPAQLRAVEAELPMRGMLALASAGDTLFALEPAVGLHAIDVRPGQAPAVLQTLTIPGLNAGALAGDMRVRGSRLYIAAGLGLHVVDVAAPDAMTVVATLPSTATYNDLEISGDRMYVASIQDGLVTFDLSQGDTPVRLDAFPLTNGGTAVAMTPNGLLVADYGDGVARHPITDGAPSPVPNARHGATGVAQAVAHTGGGDALATIAGGRLVRLSSGPGGWEATTIDMEANVQASSIRTNGDWAIVSSPTLGVWRYALPAEGRPELVATTTRKGHVGILLADGVSIAEAAGFDGLHILRADGAQLQRVMSLPVSAHASNVMVDGDRAYLAARADGLRIVDLSTPDVPRSLGGAPTRLPARDVVVRDGLAFVVEDDGVLEVFDVRQPEAVQRVAEGWVGGDASRIVLGGDRAHALVEDHKVVPIDLRDGRSPKVGEAREIGERINDIAALPAGVLLAAGRMGVVAAELTFAPAVATATPDPTTEAFEAAIGTAAAAATATAVAVPLPGADDAPVDRRTVAWAALAVAATAAAAALWVWWRSIRRAAPEDERGRG